MNPMFENLPFELLNIIYSYVGKNETAELIENLVDDIEFIYEDFVENRDEPILKETENITEKIFEVIKFNKEFSCRKNFDHHQFRFFVCNEAFNCYYCNRRINRTEIIGYGTECLRCHARQLGCENDSEEDFVESEIEEEEEEELE